MRLLLLINLFLAGCFLVGVFSNSGSSVSDFERVQISGYRTYLRDTGRSNQIIIEAGGKKYLLFSHSELTQGRTLDEIFPLLEDSTEAVLWVEWDWSVGRYCVMGIEADGQLIISPGQGVKFHESESRVALLGAVVFFVAAVVIYFDIKKRDGLDWKLSRKSQRKYSKRFLRGGRRQGREA